MGDGSKPGPGPDPGPDADADGRTLRAAGGVGVPLGGDAPGEGATVSAADHDAQLTDAATLMVSETGEGQGSGTGPKSGGSGAGVVVVGTGPGSGKARADGAPEPLEPGQMVGEYRIERLLGRGGMGWVYEGIHPVIEKRVAVKVLKPALAEEPDAVLRFVAEAKAVNRIGHPNIVDIFAFGQLPNGAQYFVMDYLPGESLNDRLEKGAALSYAESKHMLGQIMDALEAAHEVGIIHRDLKPDNIYLAQRKQGFPEVELLDFGVAKLTEEGVTEGRTRTGVPIGTPAYMSPEQCRGREVDFRSDLYALGVILYELFTGHVPFRSDSYMEVIFAQVHNTPDRPCSLVEIPEELEAIILWCLDKNAAVRPQSVVALRERLTACLDQLIEQGATPPVIARKHADQAISYDPTVTPDQLSAQQLPSALGTPVGMSTPRLGTPPPPAGAAEAAAAAAAAAAQTQRKPMRWVVIAPAICVLGLLIGGGLYYMLSSKPNRKQPATHTKAPGAATMSTDAAAPDAPLPAMPAMAPAPPSTPRPMPAVIMAKNVTVNVILRSTPPGAAVFHNGKQIATTPKDLTLPRRSKPTKFRFVLKGRRSVDREVSLAQDVTVEVTLPRAASRPRRPMTGGFKLTQ